MVKKGDTLIEVALAVGIFSMIAISIVSVMSSGTSGAQLALETTLAREEVDTQAETLRFIHNAYSSNKENANQPLSKLWKTITEKAIDLRDIEDEEVQADILQYSPQTCDELYDSNSPTYNYAFIINPRELNSGASAYKNMATEINSEKLLQKASTYPRLIFGETTNNNDSNLLSVDSGNLYRAEGIYVIAVKDSTETNIVNAGNASEAAAYYDFYIRTCWYGTGNDEPSTISTVIRLHDPDAVTVQEGNIKYDDAPTSETTNLTINYEFGEGTILTPNSISCPAGNCQVRTDQPSLDGNSFMGWCTTEPVDNTCGGTSFAPGASVSSEYFTNNELTLYAVWEPQTEGSKTVTVSLTTKTKYYFTRLKDLSLCVYGGECVKSPSCSSYHRRDCELPTITLDILDNQNYYFYVKSTPSFLDEFFGIDNIRRATVEVTDKATNETTTFSASRKAPNLLYWNVFAYKNGQIVERQTRSSEPEANY